MDKTYDLHAIERRWYQTREEQGWFAPDPAASVTQMVVERGLEADGKTRDDLGWDAFIERIWEWREESGGNITRQLRAARRETGQIGCLPTACQRVN